MTRTMSMVRSGIFLMGGFSALAGLFLLLSADLLASMQLMMYIGGMLVMILFMVKMSMDPGGAMMGIAPPEQQDAAMASMKMNDPTEEANQNESSGGIQGSQMNHQDMRGGKMPEMDMNMDMSMTNEFTKPAAVAGVLSSLVLLLLLFSVHWPPAAPANTANAARMVGKEFFDGLLVDWLFRYDHGKPGFLTHPAFSSRDLTFFDYTVAVLSH